MTMDAKARHATEERIGVLIAVGAPDGVQEIHGQGADNGAKENPFHRQNLSKSGQGEGSILVLGHSQNGNLANEFSPLVGHQRRCYDPPALGLGAVIRMNSLSTAQFICHSEFSTAVDCL